MNLLSLQNRINELLSIFVYQVKASSAIRRTDINIVAESVLIPLFKEVFGYENLKNLNYTENANYPGIDLADDSARIAIQVTATSESDKIKDTLKQYIKQELWRKYDRLVIYILTEKQKSYSDDGFQKIIGDHFKFNSRRDIWDFRTLAKEISSFQLDRAQRVAELLEGNFGVRKRLFAPQPVVVRTEAVWLNLLEVDFPKQLYVADLDFNRKDVIANSKNYTFRVNHKSPQRDLVRAALEQSGFSFAVDWVAHNKQLISFHNLHDNNLPLTHVIDSGTVAELNPSEYYEISDDYEGVFKHLLGRCLQQKLYRKRVRWQNQEKLYIFVDKDGEDKRIEKWSYKKKAKRSVYERVMKKEKPDEIFFCKHLALESRFMRLGANWYLEIKPEWFFSFNGYQRSFYNKGKVDWLKKNEWNEQVFNHLKFIAYFLKYDEQPGLFSQSYVYPFLSFGKLLSLTGSPAIDDKEWLSGEENEKRTKLKDSDGTLPLPFEI